MDGLASMAPAYGEGAAVRQGRRGLILATCLIVTMMSLRNAGAAPVRLLVLGDSLTAGYGLPHLDGFQAVLGAALQARGLERGDRVALILSTSIEFFDSLLGVQLGGGIPAALYPPFRLGKLDEYFARLRKMLAKIGARYLITEGRIRKLLGPGVVGVQSLEEVFEAKELQNGGGGRWQPVDVDPDQPAFLQFSSGTTVEPKAVMVTHTNLLANLTMMQHCLVYRGEDEIDNGCVCWLPLYHDMGLVGCLYLGMYYPGTVTYMGPDTFLARPAI